MHYVQKSLELYPDNPDALDTKGFILSNVEKYEDAIQCYNEAINIDKNKAVYWNHKGEALIKLNRIPEAEECFNEEKTTT